MSRYHPNFKVQARDPKKIYVIDTGLRTVSLQSDREDWGRLAENTVYLELRRRGKQVFYYKQVQKVDFVITELGRPIDAIQVCYSDLGTHSPCVSLSQIGLDHLIGPFLFRKIS